MHREQRQRAENRLREGGIEQVLFAKPDSTKWLTGFAPPIQMGPPYFAIGTPLVWYDGGQWTLIALDELGDLAEQSRDADLAVVTYRGRRLDERISPAAELMAALRSVVHVTTQASTGLEREFAVALVADFFADANVTAVDGWLEPLRMVKTDEELVKLRRNFALTDLAHAAARAAVTPGVREIDVWNAAHAAVESAAGCRVPFGNDCVSGRRTPNNIGGWPLDYELFEHDSLTVDLSVILDGYWSDSSATYYAGERTDFQARLHRVVTEALEYGISLVRPGVVARDIDAKIRAFIKGAGYSDYPHHTGHAVGVSGHEAPRIVPYNGEVLREGMVMMLEPGIYFPGETSIRLEDGMLVTANGAELLTHHDKS